MLAESTRLISCPPIPQPLVLLSLVAGDLAVSRGRNGLSQRGGKCIRLAAVSLLTDDTHEYVLTAAGTSQLFLLWKCAGKGGCTWWSQGLTPSAAERKLRKWHCCLQSIHVSLLQNPEAALRFSVILWGCQRALLDPNRDAPGRHAHSALLPSGHSTSSCTISGNKPKPAEGGKVAIEPNTGCSYRPQPRLYRGKKRGRGLVLHDTGPPCALTAISLQKCSQNKNSSVHLHFSRWGAQGTAAS